MCSLLGNETDHIYSGTICPVFSCKKALFFKLFYTHQQKWHGSGTVSGHPQLNLCV